MPPPWTTGEILERLVKKMPIRVAFEYDGQTRTWACSMKLRDHHVEGLGADMPQAIFEALLGLVEAMNYAELEDS
jgi:hypothetical protein